MTKSPGNGEPLLLTIRDVAKLLAVSERTVARLIAARKIRHLRVGRQVRLEQEAIQDYLKAHTVRVSPLGGRSTRYS